MALEHFGIFWILIESDRGPYLYQTLIISLRLCQWNFKLRSLNTRKAEIISALKRQKRDLTKDEMLLRFQCDTFHVGVAQVST